MRARTGALFRDFNAYCEGSARAPSWISIKFLYGVLCLGYEIGFLEGPRIGLRIPLGGKWKQGIARCSA